MEAGSEEETIHQMQLTTNGFARNFFASRIS
jgi:hypothetical protein